MIYQIVAFAQTRAKAAARRAAVSTASAAAAGAFALFAAAALFAALFFWVEPMLGPIWAALICAGVAIVLAAFALTPLMVKRAPAPAPPPPAATSPDFVSLLAKAAPNLSARQLLVAAALLGVALALSAPGQKGSRRFPALVGFSADIEEKGRGRRPFRFSDARTAPEG